MYDYGGPLSKITHRGDTVATFRVAPRAGINAVVVIVALSAYVAIVLFGILRFNIWIDEAYTLHTVSGTMGHAISQAIRFEQQPPLYYMLLNAWRHIDRSDVWLRLFSTSCMFAALLIIENFARTYLKPIPSALVVAVCAINTFSIWAAGEARVYALVVLISTLLVRLFFSAFIEQRRRTDVVVFSLVAGIALYTEYYLAVILLGATVSLALLDRRKALAENFIATAVAVVLFAPMAKFLASQITKSHVISFREPLGNAVHDIAAIEFDMIVPHNWLPPGAGGFVAVGVALIAAVVIYALRSERVSLDILSTVLLTLVIVGAAFFLAVNQILREQIAPRYFSALFMPTAVLPFAFVRQFRDETRRAAQVLTGSIIIACGGLSTISSYRLDSKLGDWKRVSHYIATSASVTEPLVFFTSEDQFVFSHYFDQSNAEIPVPRALQFSNYDPGQMAVTSSQEVAAALSSIRAQPTIWFLERNPCRAQYWNLGCSFVESYMRQNYVEISRRSFYGMTVYHLGRRNGDAAKSPSCFTRNRIS